MKTVLLSLLVSSALFASWIVSTKTAGATQASSPPIVVTRDNGSMPRYCRPVEVARRAATFVQAFDSGSAKRLRPFFGYEFWAFHVAVSQPSGLHNRFDTRKKSGVLRYAAIRHRLHERGRLIALSMIYDRSLDSAGLAVELSIKADDLQPDSGVLFAGKAGMTCKTGHLVVWSVASPVTPPLSVCPPAPEGAPPNSVIACTAKNP